MTNGFWRQPTLRSADAVAADLHDVHHRLAQARNVIVVGGGAAAISAAVNIATHWPDKKVDIYFPHQRALRTHHQKVWTTLHRRMIQLGWNSPRASRRCGRRIGEPHRWAGAVEHRPAARIRRRGALGDRPVLPNTAWLPLRAARREGFRPCPFRSLGAGPGRHLLDRRRRGNGSAAFVARKPRRRSTGAEYPGTLRRR